MIQGTERSMEAVLHTECDGKIEHEAPAEHLAIGEFSRLQLLAWLLIIDLRQ